MKIIIPIISFERAGGNRVLSELASAWTDQGHDVAFLVDRRSPEPYFPTRARVLRFDAKGRVDGVAADLAGFAGTGNATSIYWGMWRALRRVAGDADVIVANHSLTAFPVALARSGRTRAFYYVQAYEPEYYQLEQGTKARILGMLSHLSYRLPLTQIANSPIYVGHPQIRARHWIPPGIDASVFRRRPTGSVGHDSRGWIIGTIGRREPAKGTIHALRAFEILAQRDPHVRLRVAYGNLPEGWSHPRAEVVTPRNDAELAAYYRSVDVLLAPGIVQLGACHYPVIEAMASGTPVVTTGYVPATEENAWIVPVADDEAIVEAIEAIRRLPAPDLELRMGLAAAATERFHWPRVAADMLALFTEDDAAASDPAAAVERRIRR